MQRILAYILKFTAFALQTSQLGSRLGHENTSNYSHAAVKPCRAHAHTHLLKQNSLKNGTIT